MKSMLGMCFNWKVVALLGVVAVGIFILSPGVGAAALLPLLLLACPLSMIAMMVMMKRGGGHGSPSADTPAVTESTARARLAALKDEERQLMEELATAEQDDRASRLAS